MAKIDWKKASELVALVAILISLGAVAYELRQTQSAPISSTYQARAIDAIGESNFIADSEFLLPTLVATNHGADAAAIAKLSEVDRGRLFHWLRARMIDWDNERSLGSGLVSCI